MLISFPKKIWPRRALALGLVVAVIISSVVYFIKPASAATTVGTSTSGTATQFSQQRKTWYDGTRYWVGYYDGTNIVFYYSSNGSSWTQNTSATITSTSGDFSIEADSTNAFIAYKDNGTCYSIDARQAASYPGIGFSWGAATVAFDASAGCFSGSTHYDFPTINRDSNNRVWVSAIYSDEGTGQYIAKEEQSTSANSVASFGTASSLYNASSGTNSATSAVSIGNGNMYTGSSFQISTSPFTTILYGDKETGGTWGSTYTPIAATATSSGGSSYSMSSNAAAKEAYMSYIDSGGKTQFRKYEDSNGASSSKINDAGNPGAINGAGRAVVRTSAGILYSFINTSGTCGVWKSTDNGASWAEQDSAHHKTCTSGTGVSMAIDSTGLLHLSFIDTSNADVEYVSFSTSSDTFGSVELAQTGEIFYDSTDIAVDSNDKPHLIAHYSDPGSGSGWDYTNRISGSWKTEVSGAVSSNIPVGALASLAVDKDNKPEVCLIDSGGLSYQLVASVGNANDAASFTTQILDTTVNTTSGTKGCSLAIDSSGNTWVAYVDATGTNQINLIEHIYGNAWTTWQTAVTDTKTGSEPSLAVAGNMMYVLYKNSTGSLADDIYNEDTASWSGETVLQSGTTLQNAHVRWAMNADNKNKPLDYLYSDGTDVYYNQAGVWRAPVALDTNSGNAYTSITKDIANTLYVYWERSNAIYYSKASAPYTSWSAASTVYSGATTEAWITTMANVPSTSCSLMTLWTEGSGSPWSVKSDNSVTTNCPPNTPTLSSPTSGSTVISTTPSLQMSATDPDSDAVKYEIFIYNTSANNGTTCTGSSFETGNQPSSGTGWNNNTTAYSSGATATYTVQTTMTRGNSYCWQAQAIDPGGTNTFGSLSTPGTFTINKVPTAPALLAPASGQSGLSTTPQLHLSSTDQDGDYLEYWVDICSTSNCSTVVASYCQANSGSNVPAAPSNCTSPSQTGWASQNTQSATAYTSGQAAVYTIQTALSANTQYWWRAYAIDPNGSNTWSSASSIGTFTTAPATQNNINISPTGGSINIYSGTTIGG